MIPYGRHSISQADIDALSETLRSDWLTQGPSVAQFEEAVARESNGRYGIAFNSATSALHVACLALGVGPQSVVWVPANSFVATANCARYCGAELNFIDIDPLTGALSTDELEERLRSCQRQGGRLPDVVITVHYGGHLTNLPALKQLAAEFGFKVIEDASHAMGATPPKQWRDDDVGDIRVFSFHPVKMITTAEGGAIVTNEAELARRARLFGNHGIERDADRFVAGNDGPWYYEQQVLGYNYRMSDLQAALGVSQLQRLDQFVQRRREIAAKYDRELPAAVTAVMQTRFGASSYHLYPILVPQADARSWFDRLKAKGIGTQKHYIPIPAQPYYRELYPQALEQCPQAQLFYQRVMALPIYPDLTEDSQQYVLDTLNELANDSN